MSWSFRVVLPGMSLLFLLAAPLGSATASADSISSSQQIVIHAVVLPAHYVIVNSQNQVQQIISNTPEINVVPTVYLNTARPENLRALTSEIQQQTDALLKDKVIKPGVLYKRPISSLAAHDKKILPLLTVR